MFKTKKSRIPAVYRILLVAIAVMAIGGIAVNCYVGNYYRADSIAEAAIDSDREVAVTIEKKDKRIQATQYDLRHKNYTITFAPQDKEKAEIYLTQAAEQGNQYAAYLLEHWQEAVRPDVFLMTTRLLRHLGNVFADESERRRSGSGMAVDRKLRRKIREKKIAQGHAEDDHAQIQTM